MSKESSVGKGPIVTGLILGEFPHEISGEVSLAPQLDEACEFFKAHGFSIGDPRVQAMISDLAKRFYKRDSTIGDKDALIGRQNDRLTVVEEIATRDSMTKLLNRRGFEEGITAHIHRLDRQDRQNKDLGNNETQIDYEGTLAILDINGLKAINDTIGHVQGDETIQTVASILRESKDIRSTDLLVRLGGDEFGILFLGKFPEGALAEKLGVLAVEFKNRLRVLVIKFNNDKKGASAENKGEKASLDIGISIGAVNTSLRGGLSDFPKKVADALMYIAKFRNRESQKDSEERMRILNNLCQQNGFKIEISKPDEAVVIGNMQMEPRNPNF